MSALTHTQLASARRLLDRGFLLREIATRLGVRFEAVCLGLFGGNQSTKGSEDDVHVDDAPATDGRDGAEPGGGADIGTAADAAGPPSVRAEPPSGDPADLGFRQEGGETAPPQPARAPESEGEPAAVAIEAKPGQRFRLVSEHGETLHENERVLTRLPKFFWRGDAEAIAALKVRRPQWSRLSAVAVLSAAGATDAAH